MAKEIQVTKEGYDKLKKELEELNGPVRMAVAEAIREAKSHGDLRENAAYHEAKLNHKVNGLTRQPISTNPASEINSPKSRALRAVSRSAGKGRRRVRSMRLSTSRSIH